LRLVGLEEARGRTREEVGGKKCTRRKEPGLKKVVVCGVEAGKLGGSGRKVGGSVGGRGREEV
jgi:hypothetical protein